MAEIDFIEVSSEINQDERGFSFFPWQGKIREPREVLRTGHLVSIRPGQTRGNHYHPGHEEWLYPFHGPALLVWETAGQIQEKTVVAGRTLIHIPPGIAHALTNPGPEILYLLAWREPAGRSAAGPETVSKPITEFE